MGSFLVVLGVFVAFGVWLRYLRRREVEAFMQADMAALAEVKQATGVAGAVESATGVARIAATPAGPAHDTGPVPAIMPAPAMPPVPATMSEDPAETQYQPRAHLFAPVHRDFLVAIEQLLSPRQRVFMQVPLSELVSPRSTFGEPAVDARLRSSILTFAIVESAHLTLLAGVYVQPAGVAVVGDAMAEADYIRGIFLQCQWPLLVFPATGSAGVAAVAERLGPYLGAEDSDSRPATVAPSCPRCSGVMQQRRVAKGQYAGQSVWVCGTYPGCKGRVL